METAVQDPSRFVLDEDAPYLKNLAALWTVEPNLAAAIEALHPRPSYRVQASKAGPPTVSVPTADGRMVSLHSRYRPVEEAKKLLEDVDAGGAVVFYLFGFGLGYHVELLF